MAKRLFGIDLSEKQVRDLAEQCPVVVATHRTLKHWAHGGATDLDNLVCR